MNQEVSKVDARGDGISCLAFQLWEKAGCPEGRDLEFWLGAEKYPVELQLMPDAANASEAAELDSATSLGEIQVRESTITPIFEKFLHFRSVPYGLNI
jgi:hypothetical protein